jgi:hypothetical protein
MPYSQVLSDNFYPEANQQIPRIDKYFLKVHPNIGLGLHKVLFSLGVPVKILKIFLPSSF